MSNMNTVQTGDSQNSALVKFYGRSSIVATTSAEYTLCIEKLLATTSMVADLARKTRDADWKGLETDLTALTNYLLNPDNRVRQFQLELLTDALIPYLHKMKDHYHLDKYRFRQLSTIIRSLMLCSSSSQDPNGTHPAHVLQIIDDVIYELRSKQSVLWKSELLTVLDSAASKQWQPILHDNKLILQNIGGKLIFLGLIGALGWPLALLYPMYRMTFNIMRIAQEWEAKKQLTPQSIFDLAKTAVILFASMQVMSILQMYATLGYCCLLSGGGALFLSTNQVLLKQATPAIAPHIQHVDMFMQMVSSLDPSKIKSLLQSGLRFDSLAAALSSSSLDASTPMSDRVEVLPDDDSGALNERQHDIPVANPISVPMDVDSNYSTSDFVSEADILIDAFDNIDSNAPTVDTGIRRRVVGYL